MNYIGSKRSLIDFIMSAIWDTLQQNNDRRTPAEMRAADLFAGTGVVGAALKQAGFHVDANDLQYYSYVLCRHLVGNNGPEPARAAELCARLDEVPAQEGFIYQNYAMGGTRGGAERMYFSDENAARCDGMRTVLEQWRQAGTVNEDEYFFLLASLLESADRYANTASVYGAYLKHLKRAAQRRLTVSPLPVTVGAGDYRVFNSDANELAHTLSGDILYLDPPYNARQYCSNYHLLETLARGDQPNLVGKTGLRADASQTQKSAFCSTRQVGDAFEDIIRAAQYRYIFLSYNNEGLMPFERIGEIMSRYGSYQVRTQKYRRFKADSDANRCHKDNATAESLHILVKQTYSHST